MKGRVKGANQWIVFYNVRFVVEKQSELQHENYTYSCICESTNLIEIQQPS